MGTEITTARGAMPEIKTGYSALSEPQRQAHRNRIGLRVSAFLRPFWRDADLTDAEMVLDNEIWQDVLQTYSGNQIKAAMVAYQTKGPRKQSGTLHRPDAGMIVDLIKSEDSAGTDQFYADWINGETYIHAGAISERIAVRLYEAKLVTLERLIERKVVIPDRPKRGDEAADIMAEVLGDSGIVVKRFK